MTLYTATHWGVYEVEQTHDGRPKLVPYKRDANPSEIGLHQLAAATHRSRVARPAVRQGWLEQGPGGRTEGRGRDAFVEVEWDVALDLVAAELNRVRTKFGNEAIFGGSYGWSSAGRFHHAQSQIHRFLNSIGGYVRHSDSYSIAAAQVVMGHIVASMAVLEFAHTSWPVLKEHTEMFVSFGGIPVKNTQVSSGGATKHRVADGIREMAAAGCKFVNVSPVRDNLVIAGVDVEWIPIRPNTDCALMLAVGWVLETEGLASREFLDRYTVGYETLRKYVLGLTDGIPKTPSWASAITGISSERIALLAREMASHRTMLNASWSLQRARYGEQPYWALVSVASMLGQIGLPGGGFGVGYGATNSVGSPERSLPGPTLAQGANGVTAFIPVARIADMLLGPGESFTYQGRSFTYPDIRIVYWAGGNPFHHHQDLNRLREAWCKPETIIVHEQFWTATAKHADIVLPATMSIERDDLGFANREGHLIAMPKVVEPFGEARDDYTIFRELAARLQVDGAFSEGRDARGWLRQLYDTTAEKWTQSGIEMPKFDDFWLSGMLELDPPIRQPIMLEDFRKDPAAYKLSTPSGKIELFSERVAGFGIADCPGHAVWLEPPEWLGSEKAQRYPLHLISDQPKRRLHSQLDCSPWSRADKIADREPIFINPSDGASRGIKTGDVVTVYNDRGRCLAGAYLTDDVMPGVVRMSTGSWYDPEEGSGIEKHGNPNVLTLDVGCSGLSQGSSAQTCLVDISGPVADPPSVGAFEPPQFVESSAHKRTTTRS